MDWPTHPPASSGKRIQLTIASLGEHGEGVTIYHEHPLFVEGALPGETVEVEIQLEKASYRTARLLRILQASPHRTQPPCPYFPTCGGCQLQHLDLAGQLLEKRLRVTKALEQRGLSSQVDSVRPSLSAWAYRCKMVMPVQGTDLGLYAAHSHQLIPLDACQVHCPQGELARSAIQQWLRQVGPLPALRHVLMRSSSLNQQVLVGLMVDQEAATHSTINWEEQATALRRRCPQISGVVLNRQVGPSNTILGPDTQPLSGTPWIEEQLCQIPVRVSATSFFQVNPPQAEQIGQEILQWASFKPNSRICDAYCGAGALALALAQAGHDVTGVEVVPSAIEDARHTAHQLQIPAHFVCAQAENWIGESRQSWDAFLLNPPRKGCHPQLLDQLLRLAPSRICMVSCNPTTLARDLQLLSPSYQIDQVIPFDLFPQTVHVETVVFLTKR